MELIDKIRAEVEKKTHREQGYRTEDAECGYRDCANEILSFIDALEVKETDLEKEERKKIAKYLYEKKGYPIDLNGNIPSFEETMKDAEQYVRYKQDKFIEMAWDWIEDNLLSSNQQDNSRLYFEQFKNYIKGE